MPRPKSLEVIVYRPKGFSPSGETGKEAKAKTNLQIYKFTDLQIDKFTN